jgi:hypothetical protein
MFNKKDLVNANNIKNEILKISKELTSLELFPKNKKEILDKSNKENLILNSIFENVNYISKSLEQMTKDDSFEIVGLNFANPQINITSECYIDSYRKYACTPIVNNKECSDLVISIEKESNGFPGNTHEAYLSSNEKILFSGEKNINMNLSNILKNNSFFEFELFKISQLEQNKINSYGLYYEEGISWANNQDYLTLKLRLTPKESKIYNMLQLDPFIIENLGYPSAIITSIKIIDIHNNIIELLEDSIEFKQPLTYLFKDTVIQYILLDIKQFHSYPCNVGHYYKEFNSIRFPSILNSIKTLGMSYNSSTNESLYQTSENTSEENIIKNVLFNKDEDIELIKAERFAIGVSKIGLYKSTFKEDGVIISNPINVKEISSFCLKCNSNKKPFKFYVRLNNNKDWVEIEKDKEYNHIDFMQEKIKSLEFKIELQKESIIYDFYFIVLE